jgi:hypothetical protein
MSMTRLTLDDWLLQAARLPAFFCSLRPGTIVTSSLRHLALRLLPAMVDVQEQDQPELAPALASGSGRYQPLVGGQLRLSPTAGCFLKLKRRATPAFSGASCQLSPDLMLAGSLS